MRTVDDVRKACQHLQFTDAGLRRLEEVLAFLSDLDASRDARALRAQREFEGRLAYLDEYGGTVSPTDARRRYLVTLGADWSPRCFTVSWRAIRPETGEYMFAMTGGLIWHGGPHDPMVVSLDPAMLWGIHT